jgi:hypothetical protein
MVERVFATRVETPPDAVNRRKGTKEPPLEAARCAGEDLNLHDRNGH